MAEYITINTVKHGGKDFLPGVMIDVDGENAKWLLEHGAIKEVDNGEVIEEDEGDEKELADYNVAELKEVATKEGIDLSGLTLKADILEAVQNGLAE